MNSPLYAPAGLLVEYAGDRIMIDGGNFDTYYNRVCKSCSQTCSRGSRLIQVLYNP
jgi:hypothetical protein